MRIFTFSLFYPVDNFFFIGDFYLVSHKFTSILIRIRTVPVEMMHRVSKRTVMSKAEFINRSVSGFGPAGVDT